MYLDKIMLCSLMLQCLVNWQRAGCASQVQTQPQLLLSKTCRCASIRAQGHTSLHYNMQLVSAVQVDAHKGCHTEVNVCFLCTFVMCS